MSFTHLLPIAEPASAKSSRSNSPVQSGAFDAMEGQFTPERPGL